MSKSINTKKAFLISFTSIILFCCLVLGSLFVYMQIRKFINNKDYQQCLNEQKDADKIALTYIPAIKQVTMSRKDPSFAGVDYILIKGIINSPNIERIDFISWSGDDSHLIKTLKHDESSSSFSYEIKSSPGVGINPNFSIVLTPKDKTIVCSSQSSNAKANVCTLRGLSLEINTKANSWCLRGFVDLGLGSAPLSVLSNTELQTIGMSENNICYRGVDNWRNKCVNKNSTINLLPF